MQWESLNHIILPLFISTVTPIEKNRDTTLKTALENVKAYCKEMPLGKHPDSSYLCRLQIESDCIDSQNKKACDLLVKLRDWENKSRSEQIAIIKKKEPEKEKFWRCIVPPPIFVKVEDPEWKIIKAKPVIRSPGSSEEFLDYKPRSENIGYKLTGEEKPEVQEKLKKLTELHRKISETPIPRSCQSDSECKVQGVGKKRCGGSMGFLYYSSANGEPSVISDILLFNKLDEELNKDLGGFGTCEIYGKNEPVCMENKCTAGTKEIGY